MKSRSPPSGTSMRRPLPPSPRAINGLKNAEASFSRRGATRGRRERRSSVGNAAIKHQDGGLFHRRRRRSSTGLARLKMEEREFLQSVNVSMGSKKKFNSNPFSPQKSPLSKDAQKKSENINAPSRTWCKFWRVWHQGRRLCTRCCLEPCGSPPVPFWNSPRRYYFPPLPPETLLWHAKQQSSAAV